MEEKLLELFKLADTLNENQKKYYAKITYTADEQRRIEIAIVSKKNCTYVEDFKFQLLRNSAMKIDYIIEIFNSYIGGVSDE